MISHFKALIKDTTAVTYYVKIDATGTRYILLVKGYFSSTEATGVSLAGSAQTLDTGVTVAASATTGHTLNDVWRWLHGGDISDTACACTNSWITKELLLTIKVR